MMTKYREILRLHSRGMSQRSIAIACGASRNTVSSVILRFKKTELELPLTEDMTDHKLQALLFPETHEYSSERKKKSHGVRPTHLTLLHISHN